MPEENKIKDYGNLIVNNVAKLYLKQAKRYMYWNACWKVSNNC